MQQQLDKFPATVLIKQGLLLSTKDVLYLCTTNKHFQEVVCQEPQFWRDLWRRDISEFVIPEEGESRMAYINALADSPSTLSEKNIYYAKNGYEKLLCEPFDPDEIMTHAAIYGQKHIMDKMSHLGAKPYESEIQAVVELFSHQNLNWIPRIMVGPW